MSKSRWRDKLYTIIFESDTPAGKLFDVLLIIVILASVGIVMLDSIPAWHAAHRSFFFVFEWTVTLLFSIEYVLRLICIDKPARYARSFFGIIDLLAILPSFISIFFPPSRYLQIVRLLRVLRIFRVLKLVQYISEAQRLIRALRASRRKIVVFILVVLITVSILGCIIYLIEGEENGFDSIPRSIYWAIVTMTTVGYGDISPKTSMGQFFAAMIMILGWSIIAVPTGLVTAELTRSEKKHIKCTRCRYDEHDPDANYCKICGEILYREKIH